MSMNSFFLPIKQDWALRPTKSENKFFPFDFNGNGLNPDWNVIWTVIRNETFQLIKIWSILCKLIICIQLQGMNFLEEV